MKVLVAEDAESVRELYRVALESRGHQVAISGNGKECVDAYRQELQKNPGQAPFDVVVLDYRMPQVDGLETAKEILKMRPGQRIIFASAFVKETLMDSVKDLGQVVELLQKPFDPKVLVDLIEDTSTTRELKEINRLVAGLDSDKPSDLQIKDLLDALKRMQKGGL
jgi:CheY-like chemotaxis protein